METKKTLGFIIIRHINNEKSNRYWQYSYDSIRKIYKENEIVIIDDNSDYTYVTEKYLYKTTIIQSEYHKRGELLPYYYYLKNKLFDKAVIIHDSVFIQQYIDFESIDTYKFIWHFEHQWDQIEDETRMINVYDNVGLSQFHCDKSKWKGCFGGMSVVSYHFLEYVNSRFPISLLLDLVLTRYNRCSFERVIACLFIYCESKLLPENSYSLYGNIMEYLPWDVEYERKHQHSYVPMLKVWTGR